MTLIRWAETDRDLLSQVLPDALVLLPMGATEQHGPFLPTGTDHLLAASVAEQAAALAEAEADRTLVLAPNLPIGASDHHLPFGGTLSMSPNTMLTMLTEVLASMAISGVRRVVMINGHGGNTGVCQAAAAAASTANNRGAGTGSEIAVAHLDYWTMLPADFEIAPELVPGHAGAFETSMVLVLDPALVRVRPDERPEPPADTAPRGVTVHAAEGWQDMDGYTDHPEQATSELGADLTNALVESLAAGLISLTRTL